MKKTFTQNRSRITAFDVFLVVIFVLLIVITIYPFWHCIVGSVISYSEYMQKTVLLWPEDFTIASYDFVLKQGKIINPLITTAIITAAGTLLTLFCTAFMAYGMSKKYPGSTVVNTIVIMTMFIDAGMIPRYLLYRNLNLLNNIWVYLLPALVNTYYMIILRTNFANFPSEIEEASRIDGCSEYRIYFRIVLPLSIPALATVGLFTAVGFWNTYETSVYYVTDYDLKTLQDYLYLMISNAGSDTSNAIGTTGNATVFSENIKLANTVIAILPILCVYPFVQKYFTKGIMLGAIKG